MWITSGLLVLALGFALFDSFIRYRALTRLANGAFGAELKEIAEANDAALAQALRNELTVGVEAELARGAGYAGGHARICFGAGVVAAVFHARSEPRWALAFAFLAALAFGAALILGRGASEAARKARAHWKRTLGAARLRGETTSRDSAHRC